MQNGRVVVQNVQGRQNRVQGNNARGVVAAGNGGAQNRAGKDVADASLRKWSRFGRGAAVVSSDQYDAFDFDVDEAPTAQTLFMANLSSTDPVYDEAGPSYDSDTLSEVQDHDNCLDNMNDSHEEHEMHNDVPIDVVDSDTEYTSNSNIISYEQYVQDNEDHVVHSDVSFIPNDAIMIITNDIYEHDDQCVTSNKPSKTVNSSLTAELARYKELAEIYEKRAQFELTERVLMIDTHMRMIIKDHNVKEESLQNELHSIKMQLNSTLNYNKLIREEVSTLKQDFKQNENKLLEEFLDMKHLKEKVKDKLYKQDQVAIGYKNPFYLSKAKQVQPTLYNGHEIVKTNHARALVHDSEDTVEIAKTTRKQMLEKIKDPECVKKKVKIAPHDYSKDNYLSTFTPQKQLTTEHIFWFDDLIKMKAKALKEKAKSAKPIIAMTVYPPNIPAEVDQHVVDKKCDEIKRKNLLVKNENLIAKCLSKDVFYTAIDSVHIVSRFSATHDAYIVAQKRIVELEGENFNLKQKIQTDDHDEIIKHFSKLEVDHLNLRLKYQHLKERFGNKKSVTSSDAPAFESKHSEADPILDFKALDSQNKDLNAKLTHAKTIEKTTSLLTEIKTLKAQIKGKTNCVTLPDHVKPKILAPGTLREIVEEARVEKPLDSSHASACLYIKHYQELLEYVIGTCETSTNNSQTHIEQQPPKKTNEPMIPSTGVKDATAASGSKPRSNTKKDRTLPAKSDKKKVEDHSRNNKSNVKQKNHVDSSISYKRTIINSNYNYVYKTCNKCLMSFNHDKCVVRSLKFVKKPTVNKVYRVKLVKQVWQATGKLFTNVGFQ
ncbi:hypothetical protein Tco_1127940 [Tanacetum coccineum]